ncbi:MAG TPA: Fic family protein [Candidatus Angelobacter sp.]
MAIYWPAFEFNYTVDVPRLLPHIAAIEACKTAATLRICPPQWRVLPASEEAQTSPGDLPAEPGSNLSEIEARKQRFLITNASPAQAWVRQRFVPGSDPISLADILKMHSMVAEDSGIRYNSAGAVRQEGRGVMVGKNGVGYHCGAPAAKLPRLMDEYMQLVNGPSLMDMPPVIHALVAHFFFTTIHPFDDGNGRVSRLVAAGILFQRGYNGHGFYALFHHFYQNDAKYYDLLYQCWEQALPFDLTPFVAFGMEGLALELYGINSFIKVRLHRTVERELLTPALKKKARAQ